MTAGRNSVPLEKTLLQMDLSKGLDERARPEVGGDQSKLITTLENLVQDQSGGWVKRPCLHALSGTTDELSASYDPIRQLIGLHSGLGAITSTNEFMHYHEFSGKFRKKGHVPPLTVSSQVVAGTVGSEKVVYPLDTKVSAEYLFVAYAAQKAFTGTHYCYYVYVAVIERRSGSVVAKYELTPPSAGAVDGDIPAVKLAYISSRYLHAYLGRPGQAVQFVQIDSGASGSVWPATGVLAMTACSLNADSTYPYIYDIEASQDSLTSCVALGPNGALSRSTAGTEKTNVMQDWRCILKQSSTEFALVGRDTGVNRFTVRYGVPASDISTIGGPTDWTDASVSVSSNTILKACMIESTGAIHATTESNSNLASGPCAMTRMVYYTTTNLADTSLASVGTHQGWVTASQLFINPTNNNVYVKMIKNVITGGANLPTFSNIRPSCVVNLSRMTTYYRSHTTGTITSESIPPVCSLDPHNSYATVADDYARPSPALSSAYDGTYESALSIGQAWIARGGGIASYIIRYSSSTVSGASSHVRPSNFAGSTEMSGAVTYRYDGNRPVESGFIDYPSITAEVAATGITGSFNYVALFKYIDATGHVTWSRCSEVLSVTLANQKANITITACAITDKETGIGRDSPVGVEIYRTATGGTQYYFLAEYSPGVSGAITMNASNSYSLVDNMADATLITKALLFRQPGSANTALDRYPPPPGTYSCAHKDRVFIVEPSGRRVFYSSFYVDGEAPWYNPLFVLQPHGGSGPITGLASMDGRLVIFKADSVFVVDGDGPPENGGSGVEFSPPSKLGFEFGCIDGRSIVQTHNGIMFRSARGIEILTRSLQLNWIGERVQSTVSSYQRTLGAVMDNQGRVRFYIENPDTTLGKELVYDTSSDCWSTSQYWMDNLVTYGYPVTAAAVYDANPDANGSYNDGTPNKRVAVANNRHQAVYFLDDTYGQDGGTKIVPWTLETGWIRPSGVQGRFRLHESIFTGKRIGSHSTTMSLAFDYDGYTQSRTWGNPSVPKTLEEVSIQPKDTQPTSFRLKVAESLASPGTALGGVDCLGICFVISPKAGPQQLAEYKKG